MFVGEPGLTVRLTAVSAFTDVLRLLIFPLTLRGDYSPEERTVVTTPLDWRFAAGLLCALTPARARAVPSERARVLAAVRGCLSRTSERPASRPSAPSLIV